MARAQGARAQMALSFETVYGTPPGSGFTQMPFITSSLAAEQPLLSSELLGYGRDPRAPILDAITTDGDVEVPIDAVGFGFWLKAAFGAPTTTGTAAATGAITFSVQPAVNATVTINGTMFTFVASGAVGKQVNIGANLAATMTALAIALNASVVAGVLVATYTGTATALTILHDTLGSTGNAFTLLVSTTPASNGTPSAPTLTGGLNAHTFLSGNWTLPRMSFEVGMPEVPRFAMYSGCVLDSLSWAMERSGLLGAKAMLVAQGETIAAATAAGTPATIALKRFGHFNGAIKRDGVALGNIVSADVIYANNLDRIETIRSDTKIDGADPTIAALTGKIEVRFADTTLLTQAINGTAAALEFSYALGSGESLTLTAHAVYLPRPRIEIKGPKGVQASFDWQAAIATSLARMAWTDDADAEGMTDFYGLQRRAAREVFMTGEVFLRFRSRRLEDELTVPLQIQMLPSEMLPLNHNAVDGNGNIIRQGIEFDRVGRRTAFHFLRRHPGDSTDPGLAGDTVRVPASEVLHVIDPVESGQLRGVSRFAPAIVKLFLLDQYDDAELDRKKVAAMYAMFVTSPAQDNPLAPHDEEYEVAPGQVVRLDPGEDVTVSAPADSGSTYEPFQYRTLLQISAALGIPYGYLSNDGAKGNFSNSRLSLIEFRRRVSAWQHSVMVFQMCRPVWARFMDTAVLAGALKLPGYDRRRAEYLACNWLPTKWDWVDPLKDANAEIAQIEAGLKSRIRAMRDLMFEAFQRSRAT